MNVLEIIHCKIQLLYFNYNCLVFLCSFYGLRSTPGTPISQSVPDDSVLHLVLSTLKLVTTTSSTQLFCF